MAWTLTYGPGPTTSTFEALGLERPRRTIENQGNDTLVIDQAVPDLTADPFVAIDDQVIVKNGATTIFVGWVTGLPRNGSDGEYLGYTLAGPWRWIDRGGG